jgi:hypothetical protein
MPSKRIAVARKAAKPSTVAARQQRMFNIMRKKQPLISMDVLRALANSGLPPQKNAYNERLKELLGT